MAGGPRGAWRLRWGGPESRSWAQGPELPPALATCALLRPEGVPWEARHLWSPLSRPPVFRPLLHPILAPLGISTGWKPSPAPSLPVPRLI